MGNRFPGQACVFCPNPSVGVGEHVWPAWFIAEFHGQGPFTTSRAGVPYMKRDGATPLTAEALFGVHVPACADCNAALDTTIEKPGKSVVRKLLAHADSNSELLLSADDCVTLARWLLKVGLLSAHPAAEHDHPGVERDEDVPRLATVRPEWLDWMVAGGAPPEGFSVYVTRRDLRGEDPSPEIEQHIVLPRVIVDGKDRNFMSPSFGFAGVNVTMVWHPGWPIQHAQVNASRAVRLLPDPVQVDFGSLPQVHPKELAFWDGAGGSTMLTTDQLARIARNPLSVDSDPMQAFFGNIA